MSDRISKRKQNWSKFMSQKKTKQYNFIYKYWEKYTCNTNKYLHTDSILAM